MALKATIYKAAVNVADLDRNQFLDANLTLALWLLNDHLGVDLWIELGLPDEKRIKKACSRAQAVALFAYNSRAAEIWWQQNQNKLAAYPKLTIWYLDDAQLAQLSAFADRTMTLQATLQEGSIWLSDAQNNLEIQLTAWQAPA